MHRLLYAILLAASAASAQDKPLPPAVWAGDLEFRVNTGGAAGQTTAGGVETFFEIHRDGKVLGHSRNGCRFSGIVLPGRTPTALKLEGVFSRCEFRPLNRRYAGTLDFDHKQGRATVQLSAQQERAGMSLAAEITGVLGRLK